MDYQKFMKTIANVDPEEFESIYLAAVGSLPSDYRAILNVDGLEIMKVSDEMAAQVSKMIGVVSKDPFTLAMKVTPAIAFAITLLIWVGIKQVQSKVREATSKEFEKRKKM